MTKQKSKTGQLDDSTLIPAAALLLILVSGYIFWFSGEREQQLSQAQAPKILGKATLTIDFGDNSKRSFEGEIVDGETLFDALAQSSRAGDFSYELDENNNLSAIENFSGNNKKSWQYYLNGEKIGEKLNSVKLQANDEIVVKYD
ncbi:MAG: DUF4430 domain-containing protein [Candidatus Azambacteria bacterium]|nr:DUF4430 domain-containing protein [Candidatus Azambacteria bacterium]